MADGMIEVAKATVTLVPNMAGSQGEITSQLTGVAKEASAKAGEEGGSEFGSKFAAALKAGAVAIGAALTAATAAAVATGKAFLNAADDVAELGNTIDKESQKMNMSASAYQEWDFILEHAGASIEGMKTSMRRLTTAAEEGNEAFTALGISQDDLANMSPEEVWNATIAALQNVEDESQRTVLASQLLGRGATELAPLFNMTAEETEELRAQVYELGGVMSDDAVKAAAEYEDQLQNMRTSLKGLKIAMMSQFMPGLSTVMEGLASLFAGKGGLEQVQEGLADIVSNITELAPEFFGIAETIINSLISGFAPLLPSLASAIFSFIDQGIVTFTGMIPQLTPVITSGLTQIGKSITRSLPVLLTSLIQMTKDLVTWLASGNNVKTLVDGILQLISIISGSLADALPILLPAIVNIISQVAQSLTDPSNVNMIVNSALMIVGAVVVALAQALPDIGGLLVELSNNIMTIQAQLWDWTINVVREGVSIIINVVRNWGASLGGYISGLISNVRSSISNWISNLAASFSNGFNNIRNGASNIINNIRGMVSNILSNLRQLPSQVITIGRDLVRGLWDGISDKVDWVVDRIRGMGTRITNAIKRVFGIASPSKVWADQIGQYLPLGLYEGFEDSMSDVESDIVSDMDGLTAEMTATVQANGTRGAAMYDSGETINSGNNVINVYAAEGQDVNNLADEIAFRLEEMTKRKGAVYA